MKKRYFCILSLFLLAFSLFAKTIPLSAKINENGEVEVDNSKGKVEDRIHIENNTDSDISIIIKGVHKKKGILHVASGFISAHDTKFISSEYEDDLDDFRNFIISLDNGKIVSYTAEMAWNDLYFAVNQVTGIFLKNSNDESAADELLKWKKLLDSGVITREEFDLKKKQLLGL